MAVRRGGCRSRIQNDSGLHHGTCRPPRWQAEAALIRGGISETHPNALFHDGALWLAWAAAGKVSIAYQYAAGSPLSVGLPTTFLNAAPIGTFKLMFFGGIGFMNHLS